MSGAPWRRALPLASLALAAALLSPCVAGPWLPMTLDEVARQPRLAIGDAHGLMQAALAELRGRKTSTRGAWRRDAADRVVCLAVGDGQRRAARAVGRGKGLWAAIADAAARLRRFAPPPGKPVRVRLDIATSFGPIQFVRIGAWGGMALGVDGLAFDKRSGVALFPAELVAGGVTTFRGLVKPRSLLRVVPATAPSRDMRSRLASFRETAVRTFRTLSLFTDGRRTWPLCGGHRVAAPVEPQGLAEALQLAAEALLRASRRDGSFLYRYDPATDHEASGYSLPRHAGALWALVDLYALQRDRRLLDAAQRSIRKLLQYRRPFGRPEDKALCLARDKRFKLGSAALAALALTRYQQVTADRQYQRTALRLGKALLLAQRPDGRFICRYAWPGGAPDMKWVSAYYPGEAVLALTRLHALTGDRKWLDAAVKGASYLVTKRDAGKSVAALHHDHWLLLGLDALHRLDKRRLWIDHAHRLAGVILATQNRSVVAPSRFGGFLGRSYVTAAATRCEGLIAAYHILRRAGRRKEADHVLRGAALSAAFQLRMQHRPDSTMD